MSVSPLLEGNSCTRTATFDWKTRWCGTVRSRMKVPGVVSLGFGHVRLFQGEPAPVRLQFQPRGVAGCAKQQGPWDVAIGR
jgi:hypothetical protein